MSQGLTKSNIDRAMSAEKDYFLWDDDVTGFGLKIAKGGRKSYVVKYRFGSGRKAPTRRMTIGQHGSPWTVKMARDVARKILGRVAIGEDPAIQKQQNNKQHNVSELCDEYLAHGVNEKKLSTLATDKGRIERHIKPLLGKKRIKELTRKDIRKFMNDVADGKTARDVITGHRSRSIVKGGKGTATRTVGLLGGIFTYAIEQDLIDNNPVRGVKRFPDKKGERFLSQLEIISLCEALNTSNANPMAIFIIKLLMFTGARKGEIETLTWNMIDLSSGVIRLPDSKTGDKIIYLNAGARQLIHDYRPMKKSEYVFPAAKGDAYYQGTPKVWRLVRKEASLVDVRLHDLRHSFASIAVSGGASLPMIGALLGHKNTITTQRYAHLQDDPLKVVNERVSASLSSLSNGVKRA